MVTNQQAMEQFAKTYSQMTDNRLWGLYMGRDGLLPEAHSALLAELRKRFLTDSNAAAAAEHNDDGEANLFVGAFCRR